MCWDFEGREVGRQVKLRMENANTYLTWTKYAWRDYLFFTSSLIVIWFQSITFSQVLGHEKVIKQWNVTNVIFSVPGYRHGNPINTVNIFCSWSRYTLTSILVGFFYQLFNSIPRFPIKCVYNARTRNGFRETSISSVICSKKNWG